MIYKDRAVDESQNEVEVSNVESEYEARMLEAFVGKPDSPDKGLWYANAFSKYEIDGIEKIQWKWSWWAFFGGIWFLFYRKAYAAAGGLFLASIIAQFIPFASIMVPIFAGGFSSYFIYKTYKTKKLEIEAVEQGEFKRIEMMQELGGYNQWAAWIGVTLNVLFILGVIAAVSIPGLLEAQ